MLAPDVDLSPETVFAESDTIRAGEQVVVVDSETGTSGMSICFDLRFSWLYGELRSRGANRWGSVLADAGDKPGIAVAEIDLERVREVRQALPMRLSRSRKTGDD